MASSWLPTHFKLQTRESKASACFQTTQWSPSCSALKDAIAGGKSQSRLFLVKHRPEVAEKADFGRASHCNTFFLKTTNTIQGDPFWPCYGNNLAHRSMFDSTNNITLAEVKDNLSIGEAQSHHHRLAAHRLFVCNRRYLVNENELFHRSLIQLCLNYHIYPRIERGCL